MIIAKKQTNLGVLVVREAGFSDEEYPGYIISLENGGKPLAEVLFEVDQLNDPDQCKIHVWDTTQEDPICDMVGFATSDNTMEMIYTD